MRHEFFGSFVSFFLAFMLWRARPAAALWLLITAAVVVHSADPFLFAFVAGTGLAWLMSRFELHLSPALALACVAAGIFLFGYLEPRGSYAAFAIVQDPNPMRFDRIAIHTASGLLIITGLLGNDRFARTFANPPFRLLGRLSFPVYLFHFPLLCSLASTLFVLFRPIGSLHETLLIVGAIYASVVFAVGYAFARVDEAWLGWVNRFAARLTKPEPPPTRPH
jgi:peptidoglycan/LPS O-acetylase OafA/YrhL